MALPIDEVQLNFSPGTLNMLNVILGLIMFGVALDLRIDDFKSALRQPRAFGVGLVCQFIALPAVAVGLSWAIGAPAGVALGMILVASCPGGNVSNFITHHARGSTAVSVCMTAVSTSAAIVMTPFNVSFWGSMRPETAEIVSRFALDPVKMLGTVAVLLGGPLIAGMTLAARKPEWAERLKKPFKVGSLLFFAALVVLAFRSNFQFFLDYVGQVFWPVLLLNACALGVGYAAARLARLEEADARAVSIEVGIQNSGLGLVLIFGYFGGLGGMAVVAAWWGIWHIIAGMSLASFWRSRTPDESIDAT